MKKQILTGIAATCLLLAFACNENNTDVTNNNNPNSLTAESPGGSGVSTANSDGTSQTSESEKIATSKTDGELILEGGKLLLNTGLDFAEKQRIKDSINRANKERMFVYQIGLEYREKDAFDAYNKLVAAGISNVYVFKAGRKEYYVVKFEAKGEEELTLGIGEFKTQLGENGTEGVKVKNLTDFCDKKETIIKQTETHKGDEIKCLVCD